MGLARGDGTVNGIVYGRANAGTPPRPFAHSPFRSFAPLNQGDQVGGIGRWEYAALMDSPTGEIES
jgi:hypothetical protein